MIKKLLAFVIIILFIGSNFVSGLNIQLKNTTVRFITGHGNTLYVGGSGPNNYTRIQDAIDNSSDGDTIFVFNGTYYENLIIHWTEISLIGEDKNTTIVDGNMNGHVVTIVSDWVNIREFTIRNSGEEYDNAGIKISYEQKHIIIMDNIISNNYYGILLWWDSFNNIITGNNIISNNEYGIYLFYSSSNNISDNNISNNEDGINLYHSSNNNISSNSFFDSGLYIDCSYDNNVENNTVNGKPLVYLEDESDKVIDYEVGQVILVNCDNITVEKQNLSNATVGLELLRTNNCVIHNNKCSNNRWGINLDSSNDNNITGNNIISNKWHGIDFDNSSCNSITGNNITCNNQEGIWFWYSSSNIIKGNNIISNKLDGIVLGDFSNSNNIIGNLIAKNFCGILSEVCRSNIIQRNNFLYNSINALFFTYTLGKNEWQQNYWNIPRILPKLIFGIIVINSKEIPWFNIDWHPAKEPYNIGV